MVVTKPENIATINLVAEPASEPGPVPGYARLIDLASVRQKDDLYCMTDFAPVASMIDPEQFYEPAYDGTLMWVKFLYLSAEFRIQPSPLLLFLDKNQPVTP